VIINAAAAAGSGVVRQGCTGDREVDYVIWVTGIGPKATGLDRFYLQ